LNLRHCFRSKWEKEEGAYSLHGIKSDAEKKRSGPNMLLVRSIEEENWDMVECICESKGRAFASVWVSSDDDWDDTEKSVLPLHLALCSHKRHGGVTNGALRALVDAYPAGLKTMEKRKGRLPLHLACRYGASFDVIVILTLMNLKALFKMDKMGFFPVDYARQYCDNEVYDFLLDAM